MLIMIRLTFATLTAMAGAIALLAIQCAIATEASPQLQPPPVTIEKSFRLEVSIGAPLEVGSVDGVRKRIIPITGGTVQGARIHGVVVAGGADWQGIRESGSTQVWARYTLRTDDGTYITITNPGVRRGPAEVLQRLLKGERVDPTLYYFRSTPSFEVADGAYGWLRESVFVCSGAREAVLVRLDCYAVL
jgi:Protein of unknown function (DUF3237)